MRKITPLAVALLVPSLCLAKGSLLEKCRNIKLQMPNFRVDRVLKGPIPGLCEIWSGTNVIYYHPDRKLLFFGEIWDTQGHSLTQQSRDRILISKIKQLDLSKAIRWGRGKVKVIFITDPDCPYCRKTEKFLLSALFRDKITAYIFLNPLESIHPHAREHSLMVLSSTQPVSTLLALAKNEKRSLSISKTAEKKLSQMQQEVEKLAIRAVPVVIVGRQIIRGANLEMILSAINNQIS